MTSDAWPSPDAQSGPLPRIDDLPIVEQGYDQDAVRAAFDSFYRHAAQLDASLRALEAVEVFRRDADALRNDLRAIRALAVGGVAEPAWATQTYERPRRELPAVVFRLFAEAALIVAVAVIAGVAHLSNVVIVAVMAAAFAIVALSEWLAARARYVPPAGGFVTADVVEPAPYVEAAASAPAHEWGVPAGEPDEETEPEAYTVIGAPAVEVDPWEQNAVADDGEDVDASEDVVVEDVAPKDEEPALAEVEDAGPEDADVEADEESPGFLKRLRR